MKLSMKKQASKEENKKIPNQDEVNTTTPNVKTTTVPIPPASTFTSSTPAMTTYSQPNQQTSAFAMPIQQQQQQPFQYIHLHPQLYHQPSYVFNTQQMYTAANNNAPFNTNSKLNTKTTTTTVKDTTKKGGLNASSSTAIPFQPQNTPYVPNNNAQLFQQPHQFIPTTANVFYSTQHAPAGPNQSFYAPQMQQQFTPPNIQQQQQQHQLNQMYQYNNTNMYSTPNNGFVNVGGPIGPTPNMSSNHNFQKNRYNNPYQGKSFNNINTNNTAPRRNSKKIFVEKYNPQASDIRRNSILQITEDGKQKEVPIQDLSNGPSNTVKAPEGFSFVRLTPEDNDPHALHQHSLNGGKFEFEAKSARRHSSGSQSSRGNDRFGREGMKRRNRNGVRPRSKSNSYNKFNNDGPHRKTGRYGHGRGGNNNRGNKRSGRGRARPKYKSTRNNSYQNRFSMDDISRKSSNLLPQPIVASTVAKPTSGKVKNNSVDVTNPNNAPKSKFESGNTSSLSPKSINTTVNSQSDPHKSQPSIALTKLSTGIQSMDLENVKPATGHTTIHTPPNSVATTTSPDISTEGGPASRKGSNNTESMHKKKNMIHPVKPAIFTSNDENKKNDVIHKEKGIQKDIISSKNKELLTSIITSNKNVKGEKKTEVVPIPKTKSQLIKALPSPPQTDLKTKPTNTVQSYATVLNQSVKLKANGGVKKKSDQSKKNNQKMNQNDESIKNDVEK